MYPNHMYHDILGKTYIVTSNACRHILFLSSSFDARDQEKHTAILIKTFFTGELEAKKELSFIPFLIGAEGYISMDKR